VTRRFVLLAAFLTLSDASSLASPGSGRGSGSGVVEVQRPYRAEARIAHIESTLAAITETPPGLLQQGLDYARTLARGACSAGAQRLRVECLMVAVQRYCHDLGAAEAARCPLTMDVLLSNVLADESLIPIERRYQIVQANADSRPALAAELRRIQGRLAVDFRLATGDARSRSALAIAMDRYCLATADDTSLSYQTCVSSLVWFIEETSEGAPRRETR
jgi:hypothetical protein